VDAAPGSGVVVSGRFDLNGLAARIEHALSEVKAKRLFLDPIDALFEEFSGALEVRRAFAAMLRALRPLAATTLIAAERPSEDDHITRYGAEEFVVDNVVLLRNVRAAERRRRTVEVLKLRGADHHKGEFPFSSTRTPASRSCRSPPSRAIPTCRRSASRSATKTLTRCAEGGCTATR